MTRRAAPAPVFAALLMAALAGPVQAQAADEQVTVTAERLSRTVLRAEAADFLRKGMADSRNGQFARWFKPVCAIALGVNDQVGAVFTGRVADVARHVGLRIGGPGCEPNLAIVFTSDPKALVKDVNKRQSGILDVLPGAERKLLKTSDLPVRWWHLTAPEAYDGRQLAPGAPALGAGGSPIMGDVTYNNNIRGSRIDSPTRLGITGAVVVVDTTRMGKVSAAALSDYVALVALARLRMDPQQRPAGSIMAMFDPGAPTFEGLTDQDERFIEAMYDSRANVDAWRQRSEMAGRMADKAAVPAGKRKPAADASRR